MRLLIALLVFVPQNGLQKTGEEGRASVPVQNVSTANISETFTTYATEHLDRMTTEEEHATEQTSGAATNETSDILQDATVDDSAADSGQPDDVPHDPGPEPVQPNVTDGGQHAREADTSDRVVIQEDITVSTSLKSLQNAVENRERRDSSLIRKRGSPETTTQGLSLIHI